MRTPGRGILITPNTHSTDRQASLERFMAKRANEQGGPKANSSLRVRWVEVEVNGADTTIEEALRTVERMRRPVIELPPSPKHIANTATPSNGGSAPPKERTLFESQDEDEVEADATHGEFTADATADRGASDSQRKKRGDGDRKDRNAGIKPVGDIDFVPDGKQSLKEFFAEKAPDSDLDQILVICHFLQHALASEKIGPGHVLSGFKHVGKPVPKDLKQTIRNLKDKKAWLNFSDIDSIHLTTEGDNQVEHELGKPSADT
jgi:hypothetical protein